MLLSIGLVTICIASNAVFSIDVPPLPEKVFYNVEDADNFFKEYVHEYGKSYNVREYENRLQIFKESLRKINEKNALFPHTVFGVNHFADMTPEEKQQYRRFKSNDTSSAKPVEIKLLSGVVVPDSFDWRDKGVVSPVKNQLGCGACYIFSAIGNIEGQYAIKHNQCIALSEQQVLDCLKVGGCGGGLGDHVMTELAKDKVGCMKEKDYPYKGKVDKCSESKDKGVAKVLNGKVINITDEEKVKQLLIQTGPLSIALDATDMTDYQGGVLLPQYCQNKWHDHEVLLIGYGEDKGMPYWSLKNSWGDKWGEKGFFRLQRGVRACAFTTYGATSEVE